MEQSKVNALAFFPAAQQQSLVSDDEACSKALLSPDRGQPNLPAWAPQDELEPWQDPGFPGSEDQDLAQGQSDRHRIRSAALTFRNLDLGAGRFGTPADEAPDVHSQAGTRL